MHKSALVIPHIINSREYYSFKVGTIQWINDRLENLSVGTGDVTIGSILLLINFEVSPWLVWTPQTNSRNDHWNQNSISPSFRAKLISLLKADARQYSWSSIPHGWRRANSQSSWRSHKHQQQERSSSNISVSPLWLNRFPIIHTFVASIYSLQFWAAFRLVSPNLHYFPGIYSAPCITKSQTRH